MTQLRSIPAEFRLCGEIVTIDAAPAKPEGKTRRCSMLLYSGKPFNGWGINAILDLAGLELAADQVMPLLRQHNAELIVGQSDMITMDANGIHVEGDVYEDTPAGREVLALSSRGFRWQASFGCQPKYGEGAFEWVNDNEQKTVNGHVFSDGLIIRKARLKEGSVVPLGADPNTSAIAASADGPMINLPERRKLMAEPTTPPAPTADEIRAAERKRAADIKAAFPGDPAFALEQIEKGSTVAEAKAAFADVLQAKLAEKEKELTEAKKAQAAAPKSTPRLPVTVPGGAPAPATAGVGQWHELVKAAQARGLSRSAAVREVATQNPEVHAAYVAEANGGKLPERGFVAAR